MTGQPGLHLPPRTADRSRLEANMGGPMSRSRTERISSTLLGRDDGMIRCPRVIRLGLAFPDGADPVELITDIVAEEGYGSPEDLREEFHIPEFPLICRPLVADGVRMNVVGESRRQVIEQALLLGLCSATLFDPARPVLWTQASLTRGLELFDPAGFYA
jgi:hypothetical protein